MADYYVASTGSNTSPYDTWAKAATSITTVASILIPGDRVFVDKTFVESLVSSPLSFANQFGRSDYHKPILIIGVTNTGTTPTQADVVTAPPLSANFQWQTANTGYSVYFPGTYCLYGVGFSSDGGSGYNDLILMGHSSANTGSGILLCNNCYFKARRIVQIGNYGGMARHVEFRNVNLDIVNGSSTYADFQLYNVLDFRWFGGKISTSNVNGNRFSFGYGTVAYISGVDVASSVDQSGKNLVKAQGTAYTVGVSITFDRCNFNQNLSLPSASYFESIISKVRLQGCTLSGTGSVADFRDITPFGDSVYDATVRRQNGATDGTNKFSYKMTTLPSSGNPQGHVLEIPSWINSTTQKTATVHFVQNALSGAELTNKDFSLSVLYSNSTSDNKTVLGTNAAGLLETGTQHPVSTAVWDDLTSKLNVGQLKQKASVTFTPTKQGPVLFRVTLHKPSAELWVCPKVEVV